MAEQTQGAESTGDLRRRAFLQKAGRTSAAVAIATTTLAVAKPKVALATYGKHGGGDNGNNGNGRRKRHILSFLRKLF